MLCSVDSSILGFLHVGGAEVEWRCRFCSRYDVLLLTPHVAFELINSSVNCGYEQAVKSLLMSLCQHFLFFINSYFHVWLTGKFHALTSAFCKCTYLPPFNALDPLFAHQSCLLMPLSDNMFLWLKLLISNYISCLVAVCGPCACFPLEHYHYRNHVAIRDAAM